MLDRKFGVVFFDDESDPGAGWASVNGSAPKRISGPNELPTDTIWWTNMSYRAFFLHSEIWRMPWLRHDKYLVVSPKDVLQEWGLDPKNVGSDYAVKFVSLVFTRIMTLAWYLVREVERRAKLEDVFTGRMLREDLRRLLPALDYPKGEAAAIMKSGTAWQEITRTTVRGIKGARWVMLRKSRLAHAMELLQTPVPKPPFEFLSRRDLRSKKDKVAWVRESTTPCISEVSIQRIDGEIAPIYGFGNAIEQDRRTPRSWVAHPEFMVLSSFAELDVKSVYVGDSYEVLAPKLPDPIKDFLASKHVEYSWSAGVIAETLWRAAGLGEDRGRGPSNEDEERAQTSWQGGWLKSADKSLLFLDAMKITEMGYSVVSYGIGWIRVIILEEDIPDLIKDGMSLGLMPLLSDTPAGLFTMSQPIPWGGDRRSLMLAQLAACNNNNMLWHLDRLPLLPKDQRDTLLKKLLMSHRAGRK